MEGKFGIQQVASYLHRLITPITEWKLAMNSKAIARYTKPNLVLAPNAFWTTILRPKLNKLSARKLPQNKFFRADNTTVVVSVTDRTDRDLIKRFDELTLIGQSWKISS
jgi:hypothetical protein